MKQDFKKIIEKGKHIIKIISSNGYEAYFTGETVRNILLDLDMEDVEISTNASLDKIKNIFSDFEKAQINDNLLAIHYEENVFFIRRFQYEYRKSSKEKAIFRDSDDLIADLKTKVFSIDAMAINLNGKITDIGDGYRDINRKKLRIFGNRKGKLLDNPLISLEAIALVSELGFSLDYKTFIALKRYHPLKGISLESMLPYIDRIIYGKYFKQALFYLIKTKLYKYILIFKEEFKALSKRFQKIDHDMIIAKALVRHGEIDDDVLALCKNSKDMKMAIDLAIVTPKSQYDTLLLFNYGLKNAILANQINVLLGKATKKTRKIEKEYELLPIKKVCDLKYKGENILNEYPNIESGLLVDLVEEIKYKVLMQELSNDFDELKTYAMNRIKSNNNSNDNLIEEKGEKDNPNIQKFSFESDDEKTVLNDEKKYVFENEDKLANFEKRMEEYERRLKEKEDKIDALEKNNLHSELDSDVNIFMQHHYEAMEKIGIYGMTKERISREIRNAYEEILIENLEKYKKLRDENNE